MTHICRRIHPPLAAFILPGFAWIFVAAAAGFAASAVRVHLRSGWDLQSSRKLNEGGEVLSSKGYQPKGWYRTAVPSTVLAAQVAAGEFKDPFFGMNLRELP